MSIRRIAVYKVDDWAVAYDVDTGIGLFEDHDVDRYVLELAKNTPITIEHYEYHDNLEDYIMENGTFPDTHDELLNYLNNI